MQPVAQLAIVLDTLLQLFKRRATGVRLGTLLLRVLNFGQHFAALLLELRQLLLLNALLILRFSDPLAQCGEFFLLEFEFGMIGHRQRFTLLRQTFAPPGNGLQ